MTDRAEAVYAQLMQLPPEERDAILGRAIRALQEEESAETDTAIQAAWDEEIERRIDDMESGRVKGVTWEEVKESLRGIDKKSTNPAIRRWYQTTHDAFICALRAHAFDSDPQQS
jgi:putative addiction module component (TIGR02574 family)